MKARSAVVAASMAGLALLAGCSTTISGSALAATTLAATELPAPESPGSPTDGADPTISEPPAGSSTLVGAPSSSGESPAPADSTPGGSSDTPAPQGTDLDAGSVAWLSTFCTGFSGVMQYAAPNTAGMSEAEVIQTIADAYTGMSDAAIGTVDALDALPAPEFPGAATLSPAIHDWLTAVSSVYSDGAHRIETGTYATDQELESEINSIEANMGTANEEVGVAFSQADPSVQDTLQSLPECQALTGDS